jgi:hypothetical protein
LVLAERHGPPKDAVQISFANPFSSAPRPRPDLFAHGELRGKKNSQTKQSFSEQRQNRFRLQRTISSCRTIVVSARDFLIFQSTAHYILLKPRFNKTILTRSAMRSFVYTFPLAVRASPVLDVRRATSLRDFPCGYVPK